MHTLTLILGFCLLANCLGKPNLVSKDPILDSRIVNGWPIDIQDIPFIVAIEQNGLQVCGGSIVGDRQVVTSAHCVYRLSLTAMEIRSGTAQLQSEGDLHKVTKVLFHEKYSSNNLDYDVAVLLVDPPFTYSETTQNISLCSAESAVGQMARVSGWGVESENDMYKPPYLLSTEVPIYDRDECNELYMGIVTSRMLCAGFKQGGTDACNGDSGGPLVADGKLIGIVSWGSGCARPQTPGVYTDVFSVKGWIQNHIETQL